MAEETPKRDQDLDAPTPPGGPLRQDAPGEGAHHGGDEAPRRPGDAPSEDVDGAADAASDVEPETHPGDRDVQEENAETSLDQPSQ